jgi:hypothetical protein
VIIWHPSTLNCALQLFNRDVQDLGITPEARSEIYWTMVSVDAQTDTKV